MLAYVRTGGDNALNYETAKCCDAEPKQASATQVVVPVCIETCQNNTCDTHNMKGRQVY